MVPLGSLTMRILLEYRSSFINDIAVLQAHQILSGSLSSFVGAEQTSVACSLLIEKTGRHPLLVGGYILMAGWAVPEERHTVTIRQPAADYLTP